VACLTIFRMGYAQPALDKISSTTRREIRKATGSDCQPYGINIGFIKLMQLLQSPQIQAFRSRTLTDALCNQTNDDKIKEEAHARKSIVPGSSQPLPLSPAFSPAFVPSFPGFESSDWNFQVLESTTTNMLGSSHLLCSHALPLPGDKTLAILAITSF
jgi:hypothetical protein